MKKPDKKNYIKGWTAIDDENNLKICGYNQACDDHEPYIKSLKDRIQELEGLIKVYHKNQSLRLSEEEVAKIPALVDELERCKKGLTMEDGVMAMRYDTRKLCFVLDDFKALAKAICNHKEIRNELVT